MTRQDDYWLSRACRDRRLPANAFRLAFAIWRQSARGKLRGTTEQLMSYSGVKSSPVLLHSLDRLAALRYIAYDRECRGGPLLISILHADDRSAGSAT